MGTSGTPQKINQQVMDEAADWFVEFREGAAGAAAQENFGAWLRRSPQHIEAYLEIAAFWEDLPQVVSKEDIDVGALVASARDEGNIVRFGSVLSAAAAVEPSTDEKRTISRSFPETFDNTDHGLQPATRPRLYRFGIAASVLIACAAGGVLTWQYAPRGPTYSTDIGEQRSIALADGSTIDLNSRSRVRVHYTEEQRDIDLLEGQALFRVAKDPSRPFVVHAADTHVRAVGTQFDVYRRKRDTTVTVLEGRVAVGTGTTSSKPIPQQLPDTLEGQGSARPRESGGDATIGEVVVTAGEQVVVTAEAMQLPTRANVAAVTAWTQRQLVFQGAPLADVVEEFNRYNTRPLVIDDPSIESVRISGVFSSTDPTALLQFLRERQVFTVSETEAEILISAR